MERWNSLMMRAFKGVLGQAGAGLAYQGSLKTACFREKSAKVGP
jgi:hypothetical protein